MKESYSKEEIEEFREIIEEKIQTATYEIAEYKKFIGNDNNGTEDTAHSVNPIEDSQMLMSKEEAYIHLGRQEKFLKNLQAAMTRIENGTYGICRVTGKKISKERLRSVPHTTQSIQIKKQQ